VCWRTGGLERRDISSGAEAHFVVSFDVGVEAPTPGTKHILRV
jgi:hypothetical protein